MTKIKSVTAVVVIAAINFASAHDPDCMYMKCEFKFKGGYHDECLGTDGRSLIRDVECSNGNTIHICCKLPYRAGIQKSRQARFRFVTRLASNPVLDISSNCRKRVLCELSCKDGLTGLSRSSYPEVFPSENPADQEYINAFMDGEAQSCYQTSNDTEDKQYDDISCENNCHSKYPECVQDMERSYNSKLFYESVRIFHALGLWLFSAEWLVRDKMEASEKSIEIGVTTKKAFTLLLKRMDDLSWHFNEKRLEPITHEREKKAVSENIKWSNFLLTYNSIDPEMVEAVYEALTYEEFEEKRNITKEILASHAFGSGIWIENKANIIMIHGHTIAIICYGTLLF